MGNISQLTLSTLADNFVVVHTNEYDTALESKYKTEFVTIAMEYYQLLTGRSLTVNFTDRSVGAPGVTQALISFFLRIDYKASNNARRCLTFVKNESASSQPDLKKTRSTLTIGIATGLPKDTGTLLSLRSPAFVSNTHSRCLLPQILLHPTTTLEQPLLEEVISGPQAGAEEEEGVAEVAWPVLVQNSL